MGLKGEHFFDMQRPISIKFFAMPTDGVRYRLRKNILSK